MKKYILSIVISLITFGFVFGQGTNNDFNYDKEDLNFIFNKLGIFTFKIPVKQEKNEYIDFVIEEYKNGMPVGKQSLIDSIKSSLTKFGGDTMRFFKPKMDSLKRSSTNFHRFYMHRTDSTLGVTIKTHSITKPFKFNIENLGTGNVRATNAIYKEINKNGFLKVNKDKTLLFFYANKKEEQTLWCPSGLDKETLINRYYYCLFIIARPYKPL